MEERDVRAGASSSGSEEPLLEERGVRNRVGIAVGPTVADLHLAQLPDGSLALHDDTGEDRVRGGGQVAGAADGRVPVRHAGDGNRKGRVLSGCGIGQGGAVPPVRRADRQQRLKLAGIVGEVSLPANIGDGDLDADVALVPWIGARG